MTPVTKDEEPPMKKAKKFILVGKKMSNPMTAHSPSSNAPPSFQPEAMSNRDNLPLDLMKDVFGYLPRKKQQCLRPVCRFWNRCMATRPSHFQQLFKLEYLYCSWYDPGEENFPENKRHWPDIERSLKCCSHLEDLANALVGEPFIPTMAADMQITYQVMVKRSPEKWIYYLFPNKLTKETARYVLHLLSHIGQTAFKFIEDRTTSLIRNVRPEIAKLFHSMRCRTLIIGIHHSETNIPSPESLAAIKHKETLWEFSFAPSVPPPAQIKAILEQFAVDTRHLYKTTHIYTYCSELFDENDRWTALFKLVIEFFSESLKESHEIIPRVYFRFVVGEPDWPLLPFSDMQPTSVVEEEVEGEEWDGRRTIFTHTFKFKAGGGCGAKMFKVELDWENDEYNSRIECITFLFE